MMRKILICSTFLLVLMSTAAFPLHLGAAPAAACSCASHTFTEAFDRAGLVFKGTAIDVAVGGSPIGWTSADPVMVRFDVDEVWKGEVPAEVAIETVRTEASCGFVFEEGRDYLVFVRGGRTGICERTASIHDAEDDLMALGSGMPPSTGFVVREEVSGGACGAPASPGSHGADFAALVLLVGAAILGVRPKRRL